MDVGGILRDASNVPALMMIGQIPASNASGALWKLNRLNEGVWQDNSVTMLCSVETTRMGDSSQYTSTVSEIRAVEGTQATPMSCVTVTTQGSVTVSSGITPPASSDGLYRSVFTPDVGLQGRGTFVTIAPTTTTSQWRLYGIEVDVTFAEAVVDER